MTGYVLVIIAMLASGVAQPTIPPFTTQQRCEAAKARFMEWAIQREAILVYASCELQ